MSFRRLVFEKEVEIEFQLYNYIYLLKWLWNINVKSHLTVRTINGVLEPKKKMFAVYFLCFLKNV